MIRPRQHRRQGWTPVGSWSRWLAAAGLAVTLLSAAVGHAATAAELNRSGSAVLAQLYKTIPKAKELGDKAKGVLVFPSIVKAGFMVGGLFGEGVLLKGGKAIAYYNTVAASYGYQVGAQKYGYAMFLMTDKALEYLDRSDGWELGTGPSIVVLDQGAAGGLSTTTSRDDVYAFIFSQKGLMAGAGLQGSKVTKIEK
jgi:lipid-binding SYLF domain-containing protein